MRSMRKIWYEILTKNGESVEQRLERKPNGSVSFVTCRQSLQPTEKEVGQRDVLHQSMYM